MSKANPSARPPFLPAPVRRTVRTPPAFMVLRVAAIALFLVAIALSLVHTPI